MGTPRRVAMVAMHSSPAAAPGTVDAGGTGIALASVAIELARLGVEVDILARAVAGPRTVSLGEGVHVRELAAGPRGRLPKEALTAASDAFGEEVAALARRAEGYDLIHAHHWRSGIAVLPVALELGLPFVQSFHSLGAMTERSSARGGAADADARMRYETYLANQADALIASSAVEVGALIDRVGAAPGKVWVVPPGVDTQLFTPARAISESLVRGVLGIEGDRPIVAMIGRLQSRNGADLAVEAIGAIEGDRPVLVIVGEAPAGSERFAESLYSAAGEDVVFAGALDREALADLLAAASLTLMPSRSEVFGLVALESAASGTPVIASPAAGRTGAVAVGESGIVLASRDPGEWARAITALLDDRMLLGELSASARSHALNFSWAASAAGLLGIYASLLGRP